MNAPNLTEELGGKRWLASQQKDEQWQTEEHRYVGQYRYMGRCLSYLSIVIGR
jgi:hypothetical protein